MKNDILSRYYDIAIIGGGASGLMLAASLDLDGRSGVILEGGSMPGRKLLMSGGGRCNITHGGSVKDFPQAYGGAGRLLRRCLYRHSSLELASWLSSHGLMLADENGSPVDAACGAASLDGIGRIFPASMKARDVLDLFMREAAANGWELETGCKVLDLSAEEDAYRVAAAGDRELLACNVVIATGGITYPETGSDGSMFGLLRQLGVGITDLRPALAPICVDDYPYAELSGISISDVSVTLRDIAGVESRRSRSACMMGDILFTHSGFSGPAILNISKYARPGHTISIDYGRELNELPRRMQRVLEGRARGGSGDVKTKKLAALLAADDFVVRSIDPRGMVTSGGVALSAIDLKTMRLKCFPGQQTISAADENASASGSSRSKGAIYVIGEAIDADGMTGGYNLQLCWSTARTAADALSSK